MNGNHAAAGTAWCLGRPGKKKNRAAASMPEAAKALEPLVFADYAR